MGKIFRELQAEAEERNARAGFEEWMARRGTPLSLEQTQAYEAFKAGMVHQACMAAVQAFRGPQPLTRQQIDDVMTQHYPLSSLLREEVDAFEACVRDIERLHGIGA